MKLSSYVTYAIDDAEGGKLDSALMHACIAIDGTAKKRYPSKGVGNRCRTLIRNYYWIIEPMIGAGMNLVETRFENVPLTDNPAPDFADIIYSIFRCNDAHGTEIPPTYSVTRSRGN